MTDATEDSSGDSTPIAVKLLALVAVIVAINLAIRAVPLPSIDLPSISLPDLPGWLDFLLGPGKLIVLAVIVGLAIIGESERRKRQDDDE